MPDTDITKLSQPCQNFVEKFLKECPQIYITEAYRSQERQNELYEQGRSKPGQIITWTKSSLHTQRQAIDIAFHGSEMYPKDLEKWKEVAKIAKKHHILWGYDLWGKDLCHFQYSGALTPDTKSTDYLTYETMTPEQEQLVQAAIYALKNAYNYGNSAMKEVVGKQAGELRELLKKED